MKAGRLCDVCLTNVTNPLNREVSGWARTRAEGGVNRLVAREETGRTACDDCMRRMKAKVPLGEVQERLAG